MQKADFIATPFYICRALNASNQQQAINLIKKCQRCGGVSTHADVLLAPAGHCYQIIFECFVCGLRLDVFERDLYPPEEYCVDEAKPSTDHGDTDLRVASGAVTTNGSSKKIQIVLGKKKDPVPAQTPAPPPVEDSKIRMNLNLNRVAPKPTTSAAFVDDGEEDGDVFQRAESESSRKRSEEEMARLSAREKVRKTMEEEDRLRAELLRLETRRREAELRRLRAERAKVGRSRAERAELLQPIVNRLNAEHGGKRGINNWQKILPSFRNRSKKYGYDIDKILEYAEAIMLRESQMSPDPEPKDPVITELAALWQYRQRLAYLDELRVDLMEAFEADERMWRSREAEAEKGRPVPLRNIILCMD